MANARNLRTRNARVLACITTIAFLVGACAAPSARNSIASTALARNETADGVEREWALVEQRGAVALCAGDECHDVDTDAGDGDTAEHAEELLVAAARMLEEETETRGDERADHPRCKTYRAAAVTVSLIATLVLAVRFGRLTGRRAEISAGLAHARVGQQTSLRAADRVWAQFGDSLALGNPQFERTTIDAIAATVRRTLRDGRITEARIAEHFTVQNGVVVIVDGANTFRVSEGWLKLLVHVDELERTAPRIITALQHGDVRQALVYATGLAAQLGTVVAFVSGALDCD